MSQETGATIAQSAGAPTAARAGPVRVGHLAPDFALPDASGRIVRLSDLLARGPVVVFFYPGDFSPICTRQTCAFSTALGAFREAGATIVGISGDGPRRHTAFARALGLDFPLLSDADGEVRAAYGVARILGVLPRRATYVIDPGGIVRMVYGGQFRGREHARRALQALRDARSVR